MARLTRSGVAHDLSISPHTTVVKYGEHDFLTYVFSSEFYKKKFLEKMYKHREEISESLSKRFGFRIRNDKLADVKLYMKTETRGFLIKGNEELKCQENIQLNGANLIKRN